MTIGPWRLQIDFPETVNEKRAKSIAADLIMLRIYPDTYTLQMQESHDYLPTHVPFQIEYSQFEANVMRYRQEKHDTLARRIGVIDATDVEEEVKERRRAKMRRDPKLQPTLNREGHFEFIPFNELPQDEITDRHHSREQTDVMLQDTWVARLERAKLAFKLDVKQDYKFDGINPLDGTQCSVSGKASVSKKHDDGQGMDFLFQHEKTCFFKCREPKGDETTHQVRITTKPKKQLRHERQLETKNEMASDIISLLVEKGIMKYPQEAEDLIKAGAVKRRVPGQQNSSPKKEIQRNGRPQNNNQGAKDGWAQNNQQGNRNNNNRGQGNRGQGNRGQGNNNRSPGTGGLNMNNRKRQQNNGHFHAQQNNGPVTGAGWTIPANVTFNGQQNYPPQVPMYSQPPMFQQQPPAQNWQPMPIQPPPQQGFYGNAPGGQPKRPKNVSNMNNPMAHYEIEAEKNDRKSKLANLQKKQMAELMALHQKQMTEVENI